MHKIVSGRVSSITARVDCGGCGVNFTVDIDTAFKTPRDWSMFDVAVEAVAHASAGTSVQGKHLLCSKCTGKIDGFTPEGRPATQGEVEAYFKAEEANGLG